MNEDLKKRNEKLVLTLVFIVIGMFGFGFALVPLYDVLCDITGINGKFSTRDTTKTVNNYKVDKNRALTVEFMTALNESTPMVFRAETSKLKINPGEYYKVNFYAENTTDKPLVAQAIPSISPGLAAEFFTKTECFCFTEQTFKPREKKTMPVRFVVNPELPGEYKTITLAYTFFDKTEKTHNP